MHFSRFRTPLALATIACAAIVVSLKFGGRDGVQESRLPASISDDPYLSRVQPILASRCVTCHGCTSSPCDMKMDSYAAVARGGRKQASLLRQLVDTAPARIKDANTAEGWQALGFRSVLPPNSSILSRLLEKGAENEPRFDLKQAAAQLEISVTKAARSCPANLKETEEFLDHSPMGGMPLALPKLPDDEMGTLREWLAQGAPGPGEAAQRALTELSPEESTALQKWDQFLNPLEGSSEQERIKRRLVARYIYEHAFLAHIQFEEIPGKLFELVRSRTPWPEQVSEIVTATPMDSPGTGPLFYRFKPFTDVVVQKSHILWTLKSSMRDRWETSFFGLKWPDAVREPDYKSQNPFRYFSQIPVLARARFLNEQAPLIAGSIIRGPVCYGQIATYAVRDNFWVFFVDPERDASVLDPNLGKDSPQDFMIRRDTLSKARYRKQFETSLRKLKPRGYSLEDISRSHVLTILRHDISTSLLEGAQGTRPKTAWLLSYSGIERIYYDLVAQYRPWGSVKHRISSWRFMAELRLEFEDEFLSLIAPANRAPLRARWTQGFGAGISKVLLRGAPHEGRDSQIGDPSAQDPMGDVLNKLRARLGSELMGPFDRMSMENAPAGEVLTRRTREGFESKIAALTRPGSSTPFARFLPELMLVAVIGQRAPKVYSFIANRSYDSNNFIFGQNMARNPEEDELMVLPGVSGDYPNLLITLPVEKSARFLEDLAAIRSESDFAILQARYGTLRNSPNFWSTFDWFSGWNRWNKGPGAGVLDLLHYQGF
jgi:cytochrome c553